MSKMFGLIIMAFKAVSKVSPVHQKEKLVTLCVWFCLNNNRGWLWLSLIDGKNGNLKSC